MIQSDIVRFALAVVSALAVVVYAVKTGRDLWSSLGIVGRVLDSLLVFAVALFAFVAVYVLTSSPVLSKLSIVCGPI